MTDKPQLSDYVGWKLRAKWRVAQAILGAYWGVVHFCQRMGWWWAEDYLRYDMPRWPLAWADHVTITVHMQCWVNHAAQERKKGH